MEDGKRVWKANQFVRSEIKHGYALLIFKTDLCYLPYYRAGKQQVIDFVEAVERVAGKPDNQ